MTWLTSLELLFLILILQIDLHNSNGSVSDIFDFPVPEDVVVESGGFKFVEFGYIFVDGEVIPEIVLILDLINPDFHGVFEYIFQGLKTHL